MDSDKSWVVVLLIVLCMAVLVRDTQRVPDEFRILQSGLADFHPDILKERCPVVIQDGVTDARILLTTCFRYQYLWATDVPAAPRAWRQSLSKYVIVHNASTTEDASVWVAHPREMQGSAARGATGFLVDAGEEKKYVDIVLHPCQSLVVPCSWGWRSEGLRSEGFVELALTDLTYSAVACVRRVLRG